MSDYADWLRISTQVSDPLVHLIAEPLTAQRTLGPFKVDTWAALQVFFQSHYAAGGMRAFLRWWTDEAMSFAVGAESVECWNLAQGRICCPVQAAWVTVDLQASSYAGSPACDCIVVPHLNYSSDITGHVSPVLVDTGSQSVAAGGNYGLTSNVVAKGPAMLNMAATLPGWLLTLHLIDYLGAIRPFCYLYDNGQPSATGGGMVVHLPAFTPRITVYNMAGAAEFMQGTLWAPT